MIRTAAGNLPSAAVDYINNESNTLLFSSASIWEITIKSGLGHADFSIDPTALYNGLLGAGYLEMPVTSRHALLIKTLPPIHKDPFDRIIAAQTASEGLTLLTTDRVLAKYPGSILYVGT